GESRFAGATTLHVHHHRAVLSRTLVVRADSGRPVSAGGRERLLVSFKSHETRIDSVARRTAFVPEQQRKRTFLSTCQRNLSLFVASPSSFRLTSRFRLIPTRCSSNVASIKGAVARSTRCRSTVAL